MFCFWIFLYGLLYSLSETVASLYVDSVWLTPLTMLAYILLLLRWLTGTGKLTRMGLSRIHLSKTADLLYLIPLLLLPALNLPGMTAPVPLHYMLLMFCVCFAEELMFRGCLLSVLLRHLGKWGILCAALAFSLMHSVNLFSGAPASYVLVQMLLAFFSGVYYSLIRIHFKSLYPCIFSHFLTNITASTHYFIPGYYPILIAVLICSGLVLYFNISFQSEDMS